MGQSGKDRTHTKAVMAGLECSPIRSYQDKGSNLHVHQEFFYGRRKTIESIGKYHLALILHLDLLLALLGDPLLAS